MNETKKEAKIILFAHQKGGVGKTVSSTILATELASKFKIALIDADPQGSSFLKRISQVADQGLKQENIPYQIHHFPALQDIAKFINAESSKLDYIVIDTKAEITKDLRTLIFNSDRLIVPLTAGDSDWSSLQTFLVVLKQLLDTPGTNVKVIPFYNRVRKTNRWRDYFNAIPEYIKQFGISIPEMHSLIPGKKQPLQLGFRDEYEAMDTITPITKRKGISWKIRQEANHFVQAIINQVK